MDELMKKIISLAKRRGFIFPGSEIYGGFSAGYDFGPLGSVLKNHLKEAWRKAVIRQHPSVVEIDTPVIIHPRVWKASGHLGHFSDQLVECKKCHHRFKEEEAEEVSRILNRMRGYLRRILGKKMRIKILPSK